MKYVINTTQSISTFELQFTNDSLISQSLIHHKRKGNNPVDLGDEATLSQRESERKPRVTVYRFSKNDSRDIFCFQ